MAYSNWDLKPRIYKAYQDGTNLVVVGKWLNRWMTKISSIEFLFEYYTYSSALPITYQGYGYQLFHTNSDYSVQTVPTREVVHTVVAPTPTVNADGTVLTIPLGVDISNFVKTVTDNGTGVTTHFRLFANLRWSGLDLATDGAVSYAILFNAFRSIDSIPTEDIHSFRRYSRNPYWGGTYQLIGEYNHLLRLPVAKNGTRVVTCYRTNNDGTTTRNSLNALSSFYGTTGSTTGLVFATNTFPVMETISMYDARYYESVGVVAMSGDYYHIVALNLACPVYVLHDEGIEDQLSKPMPVVSQATYDRATKQYHVYGTGFTNRPITMFGFDRRSDSATQSASFSHPLITVESDTHVIIQLNTFDWFNGSYATYRDTPLENSIMHLYLAFADTTPDTQCLFYTVSVDGVLPDTFNAIVNPDPASPLFGKADPSAIWFNRRYNSAAWRNEGWITFYTLPQQYGGGYLLFYNMRNASGRSMYPSADYRYELVTVNGKSLAKYTILMPIESFAESVRNAQYRLSMDYFKTYFFINVTPKEVARPITFDTPFIVLGENGYYTTGESVTRSERATLLVRAVDILGVTEHPPASPYNNTVRISDAEGGWGQQVTVEIEGANGIDVYPFTVAFLSGGHDGADYSYEVARFEVRLKSGVNIWTGRLKFSIKTPFIQNNLVYSGEGYSVPITLTRQDNFVVPLETSDPVSCIRGTIDSPIGHRSVNLRAYVPEYLKETPFENFVGVFETALNTMYEGASTNDPTVSRHGILDKIDGLLDLHDPDTVPTKYLHVLAANMGYDMVSGILRAKDIQNAPVDLVRYARFMVSSLSEINRNKATKDSIRGLMYSIGAIADIYYKWTTDYGTNYDKNFVQQPSPMSAWDESNENAMYEKGTVIETSQIKNDEMALTPHFRLDVDLSRLDLYSQTEGIADILSRALNTINALRPVNTVLDEMSLVIDVEHDAKQLPSIVQWWGDGIHTVTDTPIPSYLTYDSIDEGAGVMAQPNTDSIDELGGVIEPLPDSIVSPNGLI